MGAFLDPRHDPGGEEGRKEGERFGVEQEAGSDLCVGGTLFGKEMHEVADGCHALE